MTREQMIAMFMQDRNVNADTAKSYLEACHWGVFSAMDMYDGDMAYEEVDKQVLVVIGGVSFFSLPVKAKDAKHLLDSVKLAAPSTDPMIVVANK